MEWELLQTTWRGNYCLEMSSNSPVEHLFMLFLIFEDLLVQIRYTQKSGKVVKPFSNHYPTDLFNLYSTRSWNINSKSFCLWLPCCVALTIEADNLNTEVWADLETYKADSSMIFLLQWVVGIRLQVFSHHILGYKFWGGLNISGQTWRILVNFTGLHLVVLACN